mgnify:CR=1 FL=1
MKETFKTLGISVILLFLTSCAFSQNSKIVEFEEDKTYNYISFHENGQVKKEIGFCAKKPYKSVEDFEAKLKEYKIKEHGAKKEFYSNGQLKEIVVYKKGKVIEYAKHYFEDGEEFSVGTETKPEFQFNMNDQNLWFANRIAEIENKYEIDLQGNGIIALSISGNGSIKDIKVRVENEANEKYLIEIGEQIEVKKPANKDGRDIGTKFAFKIQM